MALAAGVFFLYTAYMKGKKVLQPADIGLILSYQCQAACKHCLYNCGPRWTEWIDPETVFEALEMMLTWGSSVQVHLTGGEPFLNFPLLLESVKMAQDLGIASCVETNASWCTTPNSVAASFETLHAAGLSAILISCTPFHAETIPLTRTLLAIDRALPVFGPQNVFVYLPEWIDQLLRFGTRTPTPLERIIETYGPGPAGLMFWEGFGLISGGRAGYQLGHLTQKEPARSFAGENCQREILFASFSHFDLYGNYIPASCAGLSLGPWRSLPGLIDQYETETYSELIRILVDSGPYGLYMFAQETGGYTPLPQGYAGKCHLCVDVRRQLQKQRCFPDLQPEAFYTHG